VNDVAGIALTGGLASRLGGKPKCFFRINGRRTLPALLEKLSSCFAEVLISTRDPQPYLHLGVPLALDKAPQRCSLAGIHGGLDCCTSSHAFFAPCDAPFLQPELIRLLVGRVRPGVDVVIPARGNGRREPLCAVYSKRCLPHIAEQLARGNKRIISFFHKVNVLEVPEAELRAVDPDLVSFINLNTPADVKMAALLARSWRG
jgi:molybdopterin-guanine dinucleotide biosynthesis protein A